MFLDYTTALVFLLTISMVNGLFALSLWRAKLRLPGLPLMALGYLLLVPAFLAMADRTPHLITLHNTLIVASQALLAEGIAAFFSHRSRLWAPVGLPLFTAVFWEIIQAWDPQAVTIRVLIITVIMTLLYARAIVIMLRAHGAIPRTVLSCALGGQIVILVVRAAAALFSDDQSWVVSPSIQAWFLLELALMETISFYGVLLLVGGRLNQSLKEQSTSLREERRAKSELRQVLHILGHELRDPLAVIANSAAIMEHHLGTQSPEMTHRLSAVRGTVKRIGRLMNSLLTVEQAAMKAARPEMLDLRDIVDEAADLATTMHDFTRLRFPRPLHPVLVVGDRDMLFTAIANLLDNALKYSSAGTKVDITIDTANGEACTTIADRGIGFPPEQIPRLGQRFFRADNAADHSGTGLGLHIVKTIAARHGGRLRLNNRPEGGAEVQLVLPSA